METVFYVTGTIFFVLGSLSLSLFLFFDDMRGRR